MRYKNALENNPKINAAIQLRSFTVLLFVTDIYIYLEYTVKPRQSGRQRATKIWPYLMAGNCI